MQWYWYWGRYTLYRSFFFDRRIQLYKLLILYIIRKIVYTIYSTNNCSEKGTKRNRNKARIFFCQRNCLTMNNKIKDLLTYSKSYCCLFYEYNNILPLSRFSTTIIAISHYYLRMSKGKRVKRYICISPYLRKSALWAKAVADPENIV